MKKADFYSFLKDAEQIAYGSNRKRTFLFKGIISLLIIEMFFIGAFPMTVIAGNLPEMSGGYKQGMTVNGQTLTIDASAGNRFVWDHGFNIGADYSVRFEGIKTAINKDTSGNLSSILGSLYSDGAVYLLNPNGILFGAGSKVNVRGLVAAAVGDVEESPDGLIFSKLGTGTVINEGNISAGDFAYLVGSSVKNSGAIQASEIALAAYGNKGADSVIIASHENGAVITFNLSDSNDSSLLTEGTVENTGSLGKDSNDDSNLGLLDVTIPDSEVDDTSYEYNGTVSAAGDNIIIGNTVKAGTITVVADGNLTVDAGLDAGNNGSITLTAGKSFDNTITGTIDGGDIVISAADGNVSINGTLNAKQDLSIEAVNGNINQTAAITVGNEASIKASEDINLNSLDNNFAGAVNIEGTNIKLVDASAIELGAVTATGNLDVNAQGAITQSGAADVEGTTKLVAKSDTEKFDITLNNGANNFNDIAAEGANITLVDANTIKLSEVTASTLTLGADSEVSGTVSATDIAAGTTTVKVNTGADVNVGETLTAGTLDVDGGAVDAKNITAAVDQDGGEITVTETIKGDVEVDGATSTLKAAKVAGALTQSAGTVGEAGKALEVTGALAQNGGAITASTLTLGADSEVSGTVSATDIAAGTTTLKVSGSADVNVTETLTAGTLDVDGGAVDAKNITATVDQDGGTITVTETIKGDVYVDGDSTLEAKKVVGALTQHAGTVGHADKALEVTKALTQNGGTIKATTLTLGADSDVAGTVKADTVAADGTTLTVKTGADVDVTETLTAGTLDVDGGAVDAKNITAAVDQDGGAITVTETITGDVYVDGDSTLEAKKVVGALTQHAGTVGHADKALEVTKALTQNGGTIKADTLTLKGGATQTAGKIDANTLAFDNEAADVSLTSDQNDFDTIEGNAKNVKLVDANAIELGEVSAETLDVEAKAGAITQTATDKVAAGATTLKATGDITLANDANDFTGAVAANGKNVKLVDANAIELGEVSAGGSFVAQALNGDIAVNGAVSANNALLNAKGDITVDATVDGENVTLNAGNDVVENAAVNATADKVVVAGNNIKANSSFDANNAVYKAGNEVAFNGAANVAGVLGVQAENDITVAGTGIKADTLVLRSTAGDIDVEISGNTQNLAVQADKGTVNVVAKDIKIVNGASAVTKRVNADGVASDNESVAANGITGAAGVDVTIDGNLNASSITGGDVALNINGNADVDSISGGDIDLDVAGNAGIKSIDGANIDANIADNAELSSINGDNVNLVIGSDLTVDEMSAGDVIAEVGGNFAVGQVTAGDVELTVNGDLEDNDSLIEADNLIADVGGDIGTIDAPINVKVQRIDSVKGHNVNITDKTISDVVELGVIQAQGNLNLVAESIGMPNGEGGYVDANGDALNISVGADALLNIAGYMGRASDQLEVKINGNVTIDSSNLFGLPIINVAGQIGTPINYFYMLFEGNAASLNWNRYIGNGKIPGIVIYNGQVYAASPDLWLKINRALAFTIETPELKSKQGVFGAPLFIHTDMDVSEAASIGAVDYISIASTSLDTLADPDVNEALIYIDDDSSKDRIKRRFERNVKNPNGLDKLYSREFTSSVK